MAKKTKTAEETALVERAESAILIAIELQDIVKNIMENGGECDDNTMANLDAWTAKFEVKAENIGHVDTRLSFDVEYYKAIEAAAKGKRVAIENTQKRLKKYLKDCMVVADTKTIRGDLFTFSLTKGRASLEITNEGKLPCNLVEVVEVTKPKSAEIKEKILAGEVVPGAEVVYGESFVTIRKAGKKE